MDADPPYAQFAMKARDEARRKARARRRLRGAIGKIKMLNLAAKATAGAWWEEADDVAEGEDDHLWAMSGKHRRDPTHKKLAALSLLDRRTRTAGPAKKYESERIVRARTKIVRAGRVARAKLDARERASMGVWHGEEYPSRGGADKAVATVRKRLAMAVDAEKRKGWAVGGRQTTLADRLAGVSLGSPGKKKKKGGGTKKKGLGGLSSLMQKKKKGKKGKKKEKENDEEDALAAAKAATFQHLYSGKFGESGMAGRAANPLCMRCGRNRAGFPVAACGHRAVCHACKAHVVDDMTGNALTVTPCIICTASSFSLSTGRDAWLFFRDA